MGRSIRCLKRIFLGQGFICIIICRLMFQISRGLKRRVGLRVASHQVGLSSGWPLIKLVFRQVGLSSSWSFLKLASHQVGLPQGGLSSNWSSSSWPLIKLIFLQDGISSSWSFIRVVCHQSGLSSGWSFVRPIFRSDLH